MSNNVRKARNAKLEFWFNHKRNCCFYGRSGVGKTEIIRESLEKFGLKFGESVAYYSTHSADFIGDPAKAEVILFDDLNDPGAQKAAHEVMGLKVWKGTPVTAYVWGSYRAETEEKDEDIEALLNVTKQFEIVVAIPYEPRLDWFAEKFGERIARTAIEWWDDLDEVKDLVSPRTLATALTVFMERGDIRDVLPVQSNVAKLAIALNSGPMVEKLEELLKNKDDLKTAGFLSNENNFAAATRYIYKSQEMMEYFLPLLHTYHLLRYMKDQNVVFKYVLSHAATVPTLKETCKQILQENTDPGTCKRIRHWLTDHPETAKDFITE